MSRKLLFAAGLLMCFNFELEPPPDRGEILADSDTLPLKLAGFLLEQMKLTPLDLVSQALLRTEQVDMVVKVMDPYDEFLGLLGDDDRRRHLEELKFEDAGRDALFQEIAVLSDRFHQGLTSLFFESSPALRDLTIKYGVF